MTNLIVLKENKTGYEPSDEGLNFLIQKLYHTDSFLA